MLKFKPITLADKTRINQYIKREQHRNSECTFTNFYMWHKSYGIDWAVYEDGLVIRPQVGGEFWFLPPYGQADDEKYRETILAMQAYAEMNGQKFLLQGITETEKMRLEQLFPQMIFTEDRDIEDYLYLAEDLRELKGRKYHSKRNHISYFMKNYDYKYEPLTKDMLKEAWSFLEEWCKQKGEMLGEEHFPNMLLCEKNAIRLAFEAFDELDYRGAVIRVDGKIRAFTLGEMLNDNTAVIHIEKGDYTIRGIYPTLNQLFVAEFSDAVYINREEDAGDEGLRKAKLSYYPYELVKKYKGVF